MIVGLVVTPYIVLKIGIEQYGLFVLVEVVVSFLSLFDISGINTSFVKYIAEYNAKRDSNRLNQIVSLGFVYYTVFWLIICILAYCLKVPILSFFKISPNLMHQASFVFDGMLIIAVLQGSLSIFRSILIGLQRMDVTNGISVISSILYGLTTFIVLALNYGLVGIVINSIVLAFLRMAAQTIIACKTTEWLRFKVRNLNREMFMMTLGYGVRLQVANFAELATMQASKFILGHFLSLKFVGYYELGSKIASVARSFAVQLLPSLFPAASELDALHDKQGIRMLYYRGGKYMGLVAFPAFLFVFSQAYTMISLWMGNKGYDYSILTVQFLCVGYLASVITGIACGIARGMGKPELEMRSSLIVAALTVSLSTLLVIKIGFLGALIGTSVSIICGSIYLIVVFHRLTKLPFFCFDIVKAYGMPLLASILGSVALFLVGDMMPVSQGNLSLRYWAFFCLAVRGVIFLTVYVSTLLALRCFDQYDRTFFGQIGQVFLSMTFKRPLK